MTPVTQLAAGDAGHSFPRWFSPFSVDATVTGSLDSLETHVET
jgi:hypothetical protein